MWSRAPAALSCCSASPPAGRSRSAARIFPAAGRDVAPIVGDSFSTEDARDRVGEAEEVMRLAEVAPGMSVADVGAGEGYYTVRLAPLGRPARAGAGARTSFPRRATGWPSGSSAKISTMSRCGWASPPTRCCRRGSFDRIFLVHMYHEVTEPYEFLWHLREGLKPDGLVIVVDADRPVKRHGMPPRQLIVRVRRARPGAGARPSRLTGSDAYFVSFRVAGPRPDAGRNQALRGQALEAAPSAACCCSRWPAKIR